MKKFHMTLVNTCGYFDEFWSEYRILLQITGTLIIMFSEDLCPVNFSFVKYFPKLDGCLKLVKAKVKLINFVN